MEDLTNIPTLEDRFDMGAWVGRQQAFGIVANQCSAAQALSLKEIRAADVHIRMGLSWDEFCNRYVGVSGRQAERFIERYNEFGEAYYRLSNLARISAETYREIAPAVTGESIEIDGESVALVPENAERIRAFLRSRAARKPAGGAESKTPPQPEASGVLDIQRRLRELLHDADELSNARLSREDYERFQRVVGYAVQSWHEIGQRLDGRK